MLGLLVWLGCHAVLLHHVHQTYGEIEWNAESRRLEVALRLDARDEELMLKEASKDATRNAKQAPAIKQRSYLANHFRVEDFRERSAPVKRYHWIGREEKSGFVWWYFEMSSSDGRRPNRLMNRLLLDQDDRYRNHIRVLDADPPSTIVFDSETTTADIQ